MDGGDLGQYIENRNNKLINEETVWDFFIQTCLGIQYLHTRKVLHRDLKSTNLFLTKSGKLKIGDLGVAKELKTNHTTTVVGTPYYLAPELCEEKPYNNKSDIWSLGCILYELCTLRHPFDSKTMGGLYLKIIKKDYRPIPTMYSQELSTIIGA
jgi:NIMA (never in mitosis gene a)-related kinase